jgi:transposase
MMVKSWYNTSMDDNERQLHKITLSLPREMWEAMTALAREHQRSFTKELIWALQEYIRRERRQQRADQQS